MLPTDPNSPGYNGYRCYRPTRISSLLAWREQDLFTATHAPSRNFSLHAAGYRSRLQTSLWALSKATRVLQTPQSSVLPVPVGSQPWDGGNSGYFPFLKHPYKSHGGSDSSSSMSTWSGGLHHAVFGKMVSSTIRLVTWWDREPIGAAPQVA